MPEEEKNKENLVPQKKQTVSLMSGYSLETDRTVESENISLKAPDGRICINIKLTPEGPVVELQSVALSIATQGNLKMNCQNMELTAQENLRIRSGGNIIQQSYENIQMYAEKNIETQGFAQYIEARRGDVRVKANDDFKVDGERIHLNTPDPTTFPKLFTEKEFSQPKELLEKKRESNMDFYNETYFPAGLFRGVIDGEDIDSMYNAVVIRARYKLIDNSELQLVLEKENDLESLREKPIEDDFGILPQDGFLKGNGTDLIILGEAMSNKLVPSMMVEVEAGPYKQSLMVFGDRVWQEDSGKLRPSEPELFSRMPITYSNAFGGKAKNDPAELPYHHNPVGKGFAIQREDAIGKSLPNIEAPDALVKNYLDRPKPVGFAAYPRDWGLRVAAGVEYNKQTEETKIKPELFCNGHPDFSSKQLDPGTQILINGMSTDGPICFKLPPCPFKVEISFDEKKHVRELRMDEVLVDLRTSTVDISYRKKFDYKFKENQIRTTTILWRK